jgi:hypothetical protein
MPLDIKTRATLGHTGRSPRGTGRLFDLWIGDCWFDATGILPRRWIRNNSTINRGDSQLERRLPVVSGGVCTRLIAV